MGFKYGRAHSKELNRNKVNLPVYKCSHCNRFDYLEPFYFDKLKRYKVSNTRTSRTTNATKPKKMWVPNVKPIIFLQGCFKTFMKP